MGLPEEARYTAEGELIGDENFRAPEMKTDALNAAGAPADVLSLAKTLWVLASGQRFPPAGEQRIDSAAMSLGMYVRHPQFRLLDRLIDRATRHDPAERPTMAQFADELDAWLALRSASVESLDLGTLSAQFGASVSRLGALQTLIVHRELRLVELKERIRQQLEPICEAIRQATGCETSVGEFWGTFYMKGEIWSKTNHPDRHSDCLGVRCQIPNPNGRDNFRLFGGFSFVPFHGDMRVAMWAGWLIGSGDGLLTTVWECYELPDILTAVGEEIVCNQLQAIAQKAREALRQFAKVVEQH